jgi:hypothetical protein
MSAAKSRILNAIDADAMLPGYLLDRTSRIQGEQALRTVELLTASLSQPRVHDQPRCFLKNSIVRPQASFAAFSS